MEVIIRDGGLSEGDYRRGKFQHILLDLFVSYVSLMCLVFVNETWGLLYHEFLDKVWREGSGGGGGFKPIMKLIITRIYLFKDWSKKVKGT